MNILEDSHHQVIIDHRDMDILLRVNDEGTYYDSWDLIDYSNNQETLHTCYDIKLAFILIKLGNS